MATKKVAHRTRRTTSRAAKRDSEAHAEGAGMAGVKRSSSQDAPNETAETIAARMSRTNAERKILANTAPGSLASKLRQLLGQGHRIDQDAPDPVNSNCMSGSFDHAIIRAAAIQIRAIALALGHDAQGENRLSPDLVLSNDDTAFALAGISMMLAVGSELADDLRVARHEAVA